MTSCKLLLSDQVCSQTKILQTTQSRKLIVCSSRLLCNVTFSLFFTSSDKNNIENTLKSSIFLYLSFINYKLLTNRTTSINWQNISESRTGIVHEASVVETNFVSKIDFQPFL